MKTNSALHVFWLVCICVLLRAGTAGGQTALSGSVSGRIADPQGASVPGAEVALRDITTNSTQTTTSNEAGRYDFPVVNPGTYDITVSKSGFKVMRLSQQKVSVGLVLTVNVTLEIGSLSETVVVTSVAGSELQTTNATVGTTINLKELELLPNLGRDATTLIMLQPGVTPANAFGQAAGSVAGAYHDQNSFSVDGGNNSDQMAGTSTTYQVNFTGTGGSQTNGIVSGVVATPIETVEEFKVNTFGQTADFNSSSGAQVQMVTRRGSDQWHGSGYFYYYATNHGAANSWVNNHTPFTKGISPDQRPCAAGTTLGSGDNNCVMPYTPILPSHRNRFGFTVGGPATKLKVLGGKTYFFLGYEGFRFPNTGTFERAYPTPAFRAGVIQVPDSHGVWQPYNLNPFPVTVTVGSAATNTLRTVTLPAAGTACPTSYNGAGCDPRGLGMSPTISTLWSKNLPLPNDPLAGDQYNTQGYLSQIALPITSNNYVARIDHDFGSKHRFFTSFRSFKLLQVPNVQVDVGGLLPGTTFGKYQSTATRPQLGELWVIGLTSNLSPRITNDLRLSYLYDWWQWGTAKDPPQLAGLGGALEIAPAGTGSSAESTAALIPYNVNNQSTRQRVWDGQDKLLRDDVTWVKGKHVFQFGGLYQHDFDYHTRTDNGSTINNQVVYQIARGGIGFTGFVPAGVPSSQVNRYANLASSVFGLVGLTQVIYTRTGSNLTIQPIGTQAVEQSTIKTYNVYFTDTWRWKPTLTINYGVGYAVETPPVEKNGAQVELVYPDGTLVHTDSFLAQRKAAALAGQAYAPILGFETTQNLGIKYPYNPFYGGISPRISVAWNPNFKSGILGKLFGEGKSVLRGGYSRSYGRLNGVNQVLVPLLGPGLLQPVTCSLALMNGTCGTSGSVNLGNVFRVGPDGLVAPLATPTQTLPQPFLPGVVQNGILNPVAGDSTVLDPDYRPESVDNFNLSYQRQFGSKIQLEVGYLGRRIRHVFEEVDLDAVPYMMTLGGETFADAYKNLYIGICGLGPTCAGNAYTGPALPFFEAALGGPASAYCTGYASCTAALAAQSVVVGSSGFIANTAVSQFWAYLNATGTSRANGTLGSWVLGRTMLSSQATAINTTTSLGYSNYNAVYLTLRMRDWHGITGISNFTYGRALGTAEIAQYNSSNQWLDIWNPRASYGPQGFDFKVLFNLGLSYQPRSFFGLVDFRNKRGLLGHLLRGWTIAPFFTFQSGLPIGIGYSEGGTCSAACQAFGQVGNVSSSSSAFESAIPIGPYGINAQAHFGVPGSNGIGTTNPTGVNMFTDPAAVYAGFRRCILGLDTSCGGIGNLRGLSRWNMDATIAKDIRFSERVGATFTVQFTNVLNHFQPADPSSLNLSSPSTFGVITGAAYPARQMEIGLRIHF